MPRRSAIGAASAIACTGRRRQPRAGWHRGRRRRRGPCRRRRRRRSSSAGAPARPPVERARPAPRPRLTSRSAVGQGVDEPAVRRAESRRARRATVSAIGISRRRTSLGSVRTSASTSSAPVPGDLPVEARRRSTWLSAVSGTCTADAVERPAGVEAVRQRQHEVAVAPRVRVVGRCGTRRRPRARSSVRSSRSGRLRRPLPPLVEAARRRDVGPTRRVVEVETARRRRAGRPRRTRASIALHPLDERPVARDEAVVRRPLAARRGRGG